MVTPYTSKKLGRACRNKKDPPPPNGIFFNIQKSILSNILVTKQVKTLLKKGIGAVLGGEGNNKGPLFLRAFHAFPQQDSSKKSSICIYDQQYSRNHLAGKLVPEGGLRVRDAQTSIPERPKKTLEKTLDA